MQMVKYNALYAAAQPALKANMSQLLPAGADADSASEDVQDEIGALVETDEYSFGSAAWYIVTQCPMSIREGLWTGSQAAWETYITSCVGTTAAEDRMAVWSKTHQALGVAS